MDFVGTLTARGSRSNHIAGNWSESEPVYIHRSTPLVKSFLVGFSPGL